ncbi:SHOCT domain-containing protein [Acinetobacter baumannii]|nr:SHOCT domain-containing protein [Acinetobacter baumannii]
MSLSEQMPSNELAKIIFFIVFQVAMCFLFFWGVIPSVILLVSYFLSKRDKDISMLIKAVGACQVYVYITICIVVLVWLYNLNDIYYAGYYDEESKRSYLNNALIVLFGLVSMSLAYLISLKYLFKEPIKRYPTWVVQNKSSDKQEPSIFKTENLKSYSVADELLKWKELKDQGLVSEDEFIKMKEKIMGNKP